MGCTWLYKEINRTIGKTLLPITSCVAYKRSFFAFSRIRQFYIDRKQLHVFRMNKGPVRLLIPPVELPQQLQLRLSLNFNIDNGSNKNFMDIYDYPAFSPLFTFRDFAFKENGP